MKVLPRGKASRHSGRRTFLNLMALPHTNIQVLFDTQSTQTRNTF
jgi:hypothetical protein